LTFKVIFFADTQYDNAYSSGEGHALCNMHYALIFSGTSVVPTSKLCIMRNMHYENMRYEIFDCSMKEERSPGFDVELHKSHSWSRDAAKRPWLRIGAAGLPLPHAVFLSYLPPQT